MMTRSAGLLGCLAAAVSLQVSADDMDMAVLDTVTIEASRVGKPATGLPYTITVITREELENQLALGSDIAQILGNRLPSFSPSRQKLSGFGETLRGREPLILIDGVPQSNPLRNGSRDGYTIDPDMIERIEIIHGANAIQGTGATGGIINFVTKTAEPGQPGETSAAVAFGTNDDFSSDSYSNRLHLQHAGSKGRLDYLVAAGWQKTGMFLDAKDRIIAVDNTQGDTMDGAGRDLFAKIGYDLGAQRLQVSLNTFEYVSDGDWLTVAGDRASGIPATSERGEVPGVPAENDVQTYSMDYSHDALGAGRLHAQLFRQEFAAIYGGGRYGVFQDPALGSDIFDQSRNMSDKTGVKLTYNIPSVMIENLGLSVGFDWLRDTTEQDLVQTGRSWVPETTYVNTAPFAQLNWDLQPLRITAGVRHESAELRVDDFTTLAAYGNTFVAGGAPDFTETLFNIGANWKVSREWTVFATRSEGFSMPDVGRVLRGISTSGQDIDSFLNLAPVVADNREVGVHYRGKHLDFRASYFESASDLGARLIPDADGIFSVMRERTEIDGIELAAVYELTSETRIGLNYAHIDGRVDTDANGSLDSDLEGINVAPDRANLYWENTWNEQFDTRLQLNWIFDREFESMGVQTAEFEGYYTADLVASWYINNANRLQIGIENLLDEQYITYYSQVYPFAGDTGYFAGRGRQLFLTWRMAL